MGRKRLELAGQQFGALSVIAECGQRYGQVLWSCRCACGAATTALSAELKSGARKSCGCLLGQAQQRYVERGSAMGRVSTSSKDAGSE